MSDYTPTDDLIRNGYLYVDREPGEAPAVVEGRKAEFARWLAKHDAEAAANTTLGIAHRLDTDDPRVGEQLVQFEDEWRKEARGEKDGAA